MGSNPVFFEKMLNQKIPLISYLVSLGASIPHYCFHNTLAIAGNCRACLVEIETTPKPITSCTTDLESILKSEKLMYYDSALVRKARENILEFLLLNHPLDCPVCDQGGDCDLQDQSLYFGLEKRRFYKHKRHVLDKELGSIVKTVMTRCIHCTRCVRFLEDIAGKAELGMLGRGEVSEIGTYVGQFLYHELSGNVIDLCPVGSFSLKNYLLKLWKY